MPDTRQAELYDFVRDQYEKLITARTMSQTRVGHLLVFAGFLVTAILTVGLPQLILVMKDTDSRTVGWLSLLAFAATFVFMTLLFVNLFGAIEQFVFTTPDVKPKVIDAAFASDALSCDALRKQLSTLYLNASEDNLKQAGEVGRRLRNSMWHAKRALISGLVFVILLVAARLYDILIS